MAASAASARCAPFSSAAAALHRGKAEFGATRIRSSAATAASASPSARARAHIAVGGGRFAASQTAVLNISTVHSLGCLGAGHRRHQRKTQDICSSSSSQVRCRVWGWRSSLGSSSTKPANAPARGSGSDDPSVEVVEVGEEGDEGKQSEEVVTSTTAATAVVNDEGLNLPAAAISIAMGLVIKYLVPCPVPLDPQAWSLLAIFMSTVTGLVIKPAPVGAWAFMALTFTVTTRTLTFQQGLGALTNEVIWLIVVATFFARAFIKTGFGDRLGLLFVRAFGKTTLSLAYGLQAAETVLSPAMPSTTARAAGVFVPIINSLDKRTKAYLIGQQLQGGNATSTLLISAAAQNFLCIQLAEAQGIVFGNPFMDWFSAASVPCILSILATPIIMYIMDPPVLKDTPEAPIMADKKLQEMGPLSSNEAKMVGGLGITVVLWIFGAQLGVSAALAAMIGLSILICLGVLTWDDALEQKGAWDTLLWFAILISMSGQLNDMGVVGYFSGLVSSSLAAANMGWMQAFGLLHFGYYTMHYFFASQSAHVGALYPAFLSMMVASGAPPALAALTLAFNTNLFGGLTHYASGQSAVYFSSGAISLPALWKQGAYMSVVNFLIFGVVGMLWWRVIGLW